MRPMSTNSSGRANRIDIIGSSVCPPAMMRALSSAASSEQASSMMSAREYSKGTAFMERYDDRGSAVPQRARRLRSDIVGTAPIWLKSLSHYRNRKSTHSQSELPHSPRARVANGAR